MAFSIPNLCSNRLIITALVTILLGFTASFASAQTDSSHRKLRNLRLNLLPTLLGSELALGYEHGLSPRLSLYSEIRHNNRLGVFQNRRSNFVFRETFADLGIAIRYNRLTGHSQNRLILFARAGHFLRERFSDSEQGTLVCQNCYSDVHIPAKSVARQDAWQYGFGIMNSFQEYLTNRLMIDIGLGVVVYDRNFQLFDHIEPIVRSTLAYNFSKKTNSEEDEAQGSKYKKTIGFSLNLLSPFLLNQLSADFHIFKSNLENITLSFSYSKKNMIQNNNSLFLNIFPNSNGHEFFTISIGYEIMLKPAIENIYLMPYFRYRHFSSFIIQNNEVYTEGTNLTINDLALGLRLGIRYDIGKHGLFLMPHFDIGSYFLHDMPPTLLVNTLNRYDVNFGVSFGKIF